MIQARSCSRAARMMTIASMPNGSEKKRVESSAASTNTPAGDANTERTQREMEPIRPSVMLQAQGHAAKARLPARAAPSDAPAQTTKLLQRQAQVCTTAVAIAAVL